MSNKVTPINPPNPLQEKETASKEVPNFGNIYTPEDKKYVDYIRNRLTRSKNQRNQKYNEFGGLTYIEYYNRNEELANTVLPIKKNDGDVDVGSGTIEAKLDAVLSNISNLNLTAEVRVFDQLNKEISDMGTALEDTLGMADELDNDEDKKKMRQRELLKQGTVFVQDEWKKEWDTEKKYKGKYNGEFKIKPDTITSDLVLAFQQPKSTLLHSPNVYEGDITEYDGDMQPYRFVRKVLSYEEVRKTYMKYENFKYVYPGVKEFDLQENYNSENIYSEKWNLIDVKDGQVEVIMYQDQPNNEFQVLINGVLMVPVGYPLSEITPLGKYNVVKQIFRPINAHFAYGGSFVASGSVSQLVMILDEMLKLSVLKNRKSFTPSYINITNRVISKRALLPGNIIMGVPPDALQPIGNESQGVTSGEFAMMKEIQDRIDKQTVSPIFTGQQGKAGTTATEVLETQRQAKLSLGLTVSACMLLEKKLKTLRLYIILENWFYPKDTSIMTTNDVRDHLNKFGRVTSKTNIEGDGEGERQIIPTVEGLPTGKEIDEMEKAESRERGVPVKKIFINGKALKNVKLKLFVTIIPEEKASSATSRLKMQEKMVAMLPLIELGARPNVDALEDDFVRVFGGRRDKTWAPRQPAGTPPSEVSNALSQALAQGRSGGGGPESVVEDAGV